MSWPQQKLCIKCANYLSWFENTWINYRQLVMDDKWVLDNMHRSGYKFSIFSHLQKKLPVLILLLSPRATKLPEGYMFLPVCMYLYMYVRMYVWSCLVIALATLFLERFRRNFTQVFSMARPRTSSRFMKLHQKSRSLLLFLENVCHHSSDFISRTMLTKLHTSVQYGKTSNELPFHDAASTVKVTYYF
jgi:hypothetical protein